MWSGEERLCGHAKMEQPEGTDHAWLLRWYKDPKEERAWRGRADRWEGLLGPLEEFGFICRDNEKLLNLGPGDDVTMVAVWRTVGSGSQCIIE